MLVNATQIFVTSEDNVKFEVGGVSGVQPTSDPLATTQPQQQTQQQKPCKKHLSKDLSFGCDLQQKRHYNFV